MTETINDIKTANLVEYDIMEVTTMITEQFKTLGIIVAVWIIPYFGENH